MGLSIINLKRQGALLLFLKTAIEKYINGNLAPLYSRFLIVNNQKEKVYNRMDMVTVIKKKMDLYVIIVIFWSKL
jgi:hypothetical protein